MNYLALYRKYRPSDFSSVVGQDEIKKILINAVEKGNITHAYLFSGPRGTGKTTTAKILAKMVNCEHLVNGSPCNECSSCRNIFTNNDEDAVEYPIEGKKENFLTDPSTQVSSITFLENFIGESTSIVCFKKILLKKKWKNLIRGFNCMKIGLWKKEQLNDLLLAFETGTIKEGEHFKSLATFTCLQEICNLFNVDMIQCIKEQEYRVYFIINLYYNNSDMRK